jgi:hypothetical protein
MSQAIPWESDLICILKRILIASIHGNLICTAGPADRGFETWIRRNRVIGEDTAIAPTANAEPLRICDSFGDCMINSGDQVGNLFVSVRKDSA